jgi:hypothetical protein
MMRAPKTTAAPGGSRVEADGRQDAFHVHQILDLLLEESWLNVYAGKLAVLPPGAPTTGIGLRTFRPGKALVTYQD